MCGKRDMDEGDACRGLDAVGIVCGAVVSHCPINARGEGKF